jgi:lysyl-tRNA synthetase, class II
MNETAAPGTPPPQDENAIIAERRQKLAALRAQGQAFPNDFRRTALAADLHARHASDDNATLEPAAIDVVVAGRLMLKRVMGKACFGTLQDMSGRIQLYVTLDGVGAEALDAFKRYDLGDILGARGTLFRTKTGELSVKCAEVRLLSKSLRPLPEKFHGMTDMEQRYRQRYVDLITNADSRDVFVKRSRIVQASRTTTRSTPSSTSASRPSSTSSGWSSAASSACSRSTATSGTRASRPGTTPSSRCSSSTRPTATTAT